MMQECEHAVAGLAAIERAALVVHCPHCVAAGRTERSHMQHCCLGVAVAASGPWGVP